MVQVTENKFAVNIPPVGQGIAIVEIGANVGLALYQVAQVAIKNLQMAWNRKDVLKATDLEMRLATISKDLSKTLHHLAMAVATLLPIVALIRSNDTANKAKIESLLKEFEAKHKEGKYKEAYDKALEASKMGSAQADFELAHYLSDDAYAKEGITPNKEEATKLMERAISKNYGQALYEKAGILATDKDVKEREKALALYKKAALQGHVESQFMLGRTYGKMAKGIGKEAKPEETKEAKAKEAKETKSDSKLTGEAKQKAQVEDKAKADKEAVEIERLNKLAFVWTKLSADNGHVIGKNNLAFKYDQGIGVAKDAAQAKKYCLESADAGYAGAQLKAGQILEKEGNLVDARKYYELAAKSSVENTAKSASAAIKRLDKPKADADAAAAAAAAAKKAADEAEKKAAMEAALHDESHDEEPKKGNCLVM